VCKTCARVFKGGEAVHQEASSPGWGLRVLSFHLTLGSPEADPRAATGYRKKKSVDDAQPTRCVPTSSYSLSSAVAPKISLSPLPLSPPPAAIF
jgi:hypothetical protein